MEKADCHKRKTERRVEAHRACTQPIFTLVQCILLATIYLVAIHDVTTCSVPRFPPGLTRVSHTPPVTGGESIQAAVSIPRMMPHTMCGCAKRETESLRCGGLEKSEMGVYGSQKRGCGGALYHPLNTQLGHLSTISMGEFRQYSPKKCLVKMCCDGWGERHTTSSVWEALLWAWHVGTT